jgi:hypothetical protein
VGVRRARQTLERSIASVTLYRPALISLFDLLAEGGLAVRVSKPEFEFDSPDEFLTTDHNTSPKGLRIVSKDWDMNISIDTTSASIRVDDHSLQMRGLFARICALLLTRQRAFYFGLSRTGIYTLMIVLVVVGNAPELYKWIFGTSKYLIYVQLAMLAPWAYYMCTIMIDTFRRSAIYADQDYPIQGFFVRNCDALVTSTIAAILGGLFVLAVQYYFGLSVK